MLAYVNTYTASVWLKSPSKGPQYLMGNTRSITPIPSTSTLPRTESLWIIFSSKCKSFKNKTSCNSFFSVFSCLFTKIYCHNIAAYQNLTTNLLSEIVCAATYKYPASALQASEDLYLPFLTLSSMRCQLTFLKKQLIFLISKTSSRGLS